MDKTITFTVTRRKSVRVSETYRCDCQLECHPAYTTYTSCNRHTVRVLTYVHTCTHMYVHTYILQVHYVCRRMAQALVKATSTDLVSQPHLPMSVHVTLYKSVYARAPSSRSLQEGCESGAQESLPLCCLLGQHSRLIPPATTSVHNRHIQQCHNVFPHPPSP